MEEKNSSDSDLSINLPYLNHSIKLLKETINISIEIETLVNRNVEDGWERNDAIIKGNHIRLNKLLTAFLSNVIEEQKEITDIIGRSIFETIVNLEYFIKHIDNETAFDEYVDASLTVGFDSYKQVLGECKERNTSNDRDRLTVQVIERTFKRSGVDISNFQRCKYKQIKAKFQEVYSENVYHSLITLPSQYLHGSWEDIIVNHLHYKNGKYFPNAGFNTCLPGILITTSFAVSIFLIKYINLKFVAPHIHLSFVELLKKQIQLCFSTNRFYYEFVDSLVIES